MARLFFTYLALFLLPFVLYTAYLLIKGHPPFKRSSWVAQHVVGLVAAGVLLVTAGFVFYGSSHSSPAGSVYVPARVIDGKLVPGHMTPQK